MKLSMWTIYHWLEYKGLRPTSAIADGKPVVEGLRFQTLGKAIAIRAVLHKLHPGALLPAVVPFRLRLSVEKI